MMIAAASGSAWSAGFALNEQSIKSMGMSQAGRFWPADATTLFGNPAGMTQLKGTNLSGNATFIYARRYRKCSKAHKQALITAI
ncbi:MAG: outer membrane protein transport protein [Moraxellaceae bacterium]|nr:outer membrane protein transport protein [Moraxellaceae bacterium]